MPAAMLNHTIENSPEGDNEFGNFVELDEDPTNVIDTNIGRDVIYQASNCSVRTSNDNNGNKNNNSIVNNNTSTKSNSSNKGDNNTIIINGIGKRINNSQFEMMKVMKSYFNQVLEGQKKIDSKIELLSQRLDRIEKIISNHNLESSSTCSTDNQDNGNCISNNIENLTKQAKNLIKEHIKSNIAFQGCAEQQINDILKAFKYEYFKAQTIIFKEGDEANQFYIIENGALDIFQKEERVNTLKEPSSFGEIALLNSSEYQKNRITVKAMSDCKLWSLHRQEFRTIIHDTNNKVVVEKKIDFILHFIRKIKISGVTIDILLAPSDITDMAQKCLKSSFRQGEVIAREGEKSKAFYMIEEGTINCYKKSLGAKPIGTLKIGDSFGAMGILDTTYIATSTNVKCLHLLFKDFEQFFEKTNEVDNDEQQNYTKKCNLIDATFDDFETIKPLGMGNFSSVKLVRLKKFYYSKHNIPSNKHDTYFALKCFKKQSVNDQFDLKQMIEDERHITSTLDSPFIVRYFGDIVVGDKTYFILEALLGGDLYKLIKEQCRLQEDWVRFYAASVLSAFTEIHAKHIAYRDLKPENLILTSQGYIKIIDFGLAKKVDNCKTYTCCGTLDYLSPEIILKTGHDMSVDYWALGVLIYEMAGGVCPFIADDQIKTCQRILSGKFHIPAHYGPNLSQIIKEFLQKDPKKRLGKDNDHHIAVKTHPWFEGFNWHGLSRKKLKAPYKPNCAIENQRLKISAPSNVSPIVDQYQRSIMPKHEKLDLMPRPGKVDLMTRQHAHHSARRDSKDTESINGSINSVMSSSKEKLGHGTRAIAGRAKNLKASMFGGYY